MKEWLKKYSIQMSLLTALSGVVISVMPYFEASLEQWQIGLIMFFAGFFTTIGRLIPQGE